MEKEIGSKEVKMHPQSAAKQKLSYDELNKVCAEMSQQLETQDRYIKNLHRQFQEMQSVIQSKRMDYLFKVLEIAHKGALSEYTNFGKDFVEECVSEIQDVLTIPKQDSVNEDSSEEV